MDTMKLHLVILQTFCYGFIMELLIVKLFFLCHIELFVSTKSFAGVPSYQWTHTSCATVYTSTYTQYIQYTYVYKIFCLSTHIYSGCM